MKRCADPTQGNSIEEQFEFNMVLKVKSKICHQHAHH